MYLVRHFHYSDLGQCYQIVRANWGDQVANKAVLEMEDGSVHPSNFPPYYCVAEYRNQIVGCAGVRRALIMSDTWEMTWNNIHPDHQRKGIGTLLLEYRLKFVEQCGGKLVFTMARYEQFNAKSGFETIKVIDGYHLMMKKLGPVSITG